MELSKVLDMKVHSIVSIVGAGGKSTLMYTLAEEFRKDYKCLVTTTTKIYVPYNEQYDFIAVGAEEFSQLKHNSNNGIYVYGSNVNEENKLIGVSPKKLEYILSNFQYVFIEADGSKRKPIKGWKNTEPVICKATTQTIGIISVESIGKEINEENVHRVNEFLSITNTTENDIISEDNIVSLVFHPKGLFKNSLGEKILFINKIESKQQWSRAEKLLHAIEKRNKELLLIDKIVLGSLLEKNYLTLLFHI
jgi:probable selenium-dependent hydroxylase accessory protein YqeC